MNLELSTKMQENGFLVDWAEAVQYNLNMTDDFKDTSEALDGWARKIDSEIPSFFSIRCWSMPISTGYYFFSSFFSSGFL